MKKILFIFLSIFFASYSSSFSIDIDDGIDIDDSIDEYHEMGKIQKNINYITRNAISRSCLKSKTENMFIYGGDNAAGVSSVNSVILGAGSNIDGDIIIVDQSRGDKSAVSRR